MWSIEEAKRLKSQHEHGWSVTESAEILERSELDIRNKLLSMGLKPIEDGEKPAKARKKRQTINPDIKARVIKLRSQGYDYKYIGEQTNTSRASIARILKQDGKTNAKNKEHGNNELAEKCAVLERKIENIEDIAERRQNNLVQTTEKLNNANLEIQMLKNKIKVLEAERAEKTTEPADNWNVRELKNVLEPLKAVRTENGLDVLWKTIGQTIGRLEMMISIAQEEERRHGF